MTLPTYDVTATIVQAYLAQLGGTSANLPGVANITALWIPQAAADVETAMRQGGLSSAAVTSATYPLAYQKLQDLVARAAGIKYMMSITNQAASKELAKADEKLKAELDEIVTGKRIGELTSSTGAQSGRMYLGNESSTVIDARRSLAGQPN